MLNQVLLLTLFVSLLATLARPLDAKEKPVVLKAGDKAPAFAGVTDEKKPWDSKKHAGEKIFVVYCVFLLKLHPPRALSSASHTLLPFTYVGQKERKNPT